MMSKAGFPVVNGATGKTLVVGAVAVLMLLIIAITAIIIAGDQIPEFFTAAGTLLVGFLIGSRVVTPDVSQAVTAKANSDAAAAKTNGGTS